MTGVRIPPLENGFVTWAAIRAELNDIAAVFATLSRQLPPGHVQLLRDLMGQPVSRGEPLTVFSALVLANLSPISDAE